MRCAERVVAGAERGRLDRVGDEAEALAGREEGGVGGLGREVDAVDDRLHRHAGPHERDAAEPRIARLPAAVGVVEVGDRAGAAVEGGAGGVGVGVGVAARDHDAASDEQLDQLEPARQLGRERHGAHGPVLAEAHREPRIGLEQRAGSCAPGQAGERKGPSRWTPGELAAGLGARAGRARSRAAASVSAIGAETNVGWNATTPVLASAAAARAVAGGVGGHEVDARRSR